MNARMTKAELQAALEQATAENAALKARQNRTFGSIWANQNDNPNAPIGWARITVPEPGEYRLAFWKPETPKTNANGEEALMFWEMNPVAKPTA